MHMSIYVYFTDHFVLIDLCQLAPTVKDWRILLGQFYCLHALDDNN